METAYKKAGLSTPGKYMNRQLLDKLEIKLHKLRRTDTDKYEAVRRINSAVRVSQGGVRGDDVDTGAAAAAEISNEYACGDLEALSRGYTPDDIQPELGSDTLDPTQQQERRKRKKSLSENHEWGKRYE